MELSKKQIDVFLDTLVKIIEDRENVTVDYSIKTEGSDKDDRNTNYV